MNRLEAAVAIVLGTIVALPAHSDVIRPLVEADLYEGGKYAGTAFTTRPQPRFCRYPIFGSDGKTILYWNVEPGCTASSADGPNYIPQRPSDDPRPPVDHPDDEPDGHQGGGDQGHDDEVGGSKGNASANNGKGGNYDRTGHEDNGKGHGRDRK